MSRRREVRFEVSLVPLADMLTNTVGIMIFVMIFAVLVAQGTFMSKHLPIGEKTSKKPVRFFCFNGHIRPWSYQGLWNRWYQGAPKFSIANCEQFKSWMNSRRVEDEFYVMTGVCEASKTDLGFQVSAQVSYLGVNISPRPGMEGDPSDEVAQEGSAFRRALAGMDHNHQSILFLVDGNSLDVFRKARIEAHSLGFD